MEISGISMTSPLSAITMADQGSLKEAVGLKLLSNQMDMADSTGTQMVKMMEQSINPHLGQNIDISI